MPRFFVWAMIVRTASPVAGSKATPSANAKGLSLSAKPGQLGLQRCLVKSAWNGSALVPLENGKVYTFFAVAVGDDGEEISWTSNIIEDSPSVDSYHSATDVTVGPRMMRTFTIDPRTFKATLGSESACPASNSPCKVGDPNNGTVDGLYIGREAQFPDKAERLFLSTSTKGNLTIEAMHPMTVDPDANGPATEQARMPGDEPSTRDYSENKGKKFQILAYTIYDITMNAGGQTHYGKIAIGPVSYANNAKDGVATIDVTIIMQQGAGVPHYFH